MKSSAQFPFRLAFGGMAGLAIAMGIGRFVFTPILPSMMEALGITASQAGWIAAANYLGYFCGAIIAAGNWANGKERLMMLMALASSVWLTGLMAATESPVFFAVIRFLSGLSSAFVMVFLSTIVLDRLASAGRSDLLSVHFAGVGFGIALSSVMIALLVTAGAGWQMEWTGAAIVSAAGFVFVYRLIEPSPVAEKERLAEPPLSGSPALFKIISAYGLFGFGYVVTATFLVAIVRESGGGQIFEATVWLVTGLAAVPSLLVWDRLSRRIGLSGALAASCCAAAVGVVSSVTFGRTVGPLVGGFLLGGTFMAITAYGLQAARRLSGQAPRRSLAVMTATFGVGQIVGPVLSGYLADWSGSFLLPSICAALSLMLAAWLVWRAGKECPELNRC